MLMLYGDRGCRHPVQPIASGSRRFAFILTVSLHLALTKPGAAPPESSGCRSGRPSSSKSPMRCLSRSNSGRVHDARSTAPAHTQTSCWRGWGSGADLTASLVQGTAGASTQLLNAVPSRDSDVHPLPDCLGADLELADPLRLEAAGLTIAFCGTSRGSRPRINVEQDRTLQSTQTTPGNDATHDSNGGRHIADRGPSAPRIKSSESVKRDPG